MNEINIGDVFLCTDKHNGWLRQFYNKIFIVKAEYLYESDNFWCYFPKKVNTSHHTGCFFNSTNNIITCAKIPGNIHKLIC